MWWLQSRRSHGDARALAGGQLPPPLPPTPGLAAESPASYRVPPLALEHVEVEALPSGGFLLTLTGAEYDGTCEHVSPEEAELWQTVEALAGLCRARCASEEARGCHLLLEAFLHARLLALLRARRRLHRRAA